MAVGDITVRGRLPQEVEGLRRCRSKTPRETRGVLVPTRRGRDRTGVQPIEGDAEKGASRAESDTQCPQIHLYASYQGFGFVRNRIWKSELQQLKS